MPTVNACGLSRHWTTPVDVIWGSTTVTIGGGRPVVVQSMTNTATADAEASYRQTAELAEAGSELVRLTVNTPDAARAVVAIREKLDAAGIHVPLVGDFHYNGHKLLTEIPECADCLSKYRINPGNVGKGTKAEENFAMMIEVAKRTGAAVRIGVNGGSLDQALLARLMDENRQSEYPESPQAVLREALVRSAVESAEAAQSLGLPANRLVLSCKVSEVQELIALYRTLSRRTEAALPEGAGDGLAALARDEPHRDLGAAVEKARALIAHTAVEHLDKAAVLAGVVRPVDFIVIDPAAAGGKRLAAPQADLSRDPTHFRSFLRLVRQSRAGLPVYFLFIIRSGVIINIVPQAGAHCNCPAGVI